MVINIELSDDVALVLLEWLARGEAGGQPRPEVSHPAERHALWAIWGALEKKLVQPLNPDYGALLDAARARLIAEKGDPDNPV